MALQKTQTINNISIPDAYIRVGWISGNKDNLTVNVEYSADNVSPVFTRKSYEFIPETTESSSNYIEQAYLYLKGLAEYSDALDV